MNACARLKGVAPSNGYVSVPAPEVSSWRNPGQKTPGQRQQTHPRTVKDKLSCRYAFKNHTKNTVTATRSDVKNAGPTQGYFDSPLSSVLLLSALIFQPFPQRFVCLLRIPNSPKKGSTLPFLSPALPTIKQRNT